MEWRSNRFLENMAPEANEFRSDCKESHIAGLSLLDHIQFIENIAIDNVNKRNFSRKASRSDSSAAKPHRYHFHVECNALLLT